MLNLDTHILLYALNGELTPKERRALTAEGLCPKNLFSNRHARESGHPGGAMGWIPAFAGMTRGLDRRVLGQSTAEAWSISAIVLWEIAKLAQLGRIEVDLDDAELTRVLSRIHTWPITLDICRAVRRLDFRSDPADELIAATSVVHRVPLVTRDRAIRKSRKVPMVR